MKFSLQWYIAAGPSAPLGGAPNCGAARPAQTAEWTIATYQDWQLSDREWGAISHELARQGL